jgi:ribosomal protein L13E
MVIGIRVEMRITNRNNQTLQFLLKRLVELGQAWLINKMKCALLQLYQTNRVEKRKKELHEEKFDYNSVATLENLKNTTSN